MNHAPNLEHWPVGAIVIHDADAKEPRMLMKIVGFTRDGYAKTKYLGSRTRREIHTNRMVVLHDPRRFGLLAQEFTALQIERYQDSFEQVRGWNKTYSELGMAVCVVLPTYDKLRTTTTSEAFIDRNLMAKVYLAIGQTAFFLEDLCAVETEEGANAPV